MASTSDKVDDGALSNPENTPLDKTPVIQPPRKNLPDNCSAVQAGKKRRHEKSSSKSARKHSKGSKKCRSKSRRYSSSSSSSDSSSSSSSSTSGSDSDEPARPSNSNRSLLSHSTSTVNEDIDLSEEIVESAATAAFQGMSKSTRKSMARENPVPFHEDLRPKKVDSFIKKFLKKKGANFNSAMDRRQLNLAGRIIDPMGPLLRLWQSALSAQEENTGLDPSAVIESVQNAISFIGNASHCALVDRRKGLLAKVSPDCLDLVDDPALFAPNTADLFGKKFKKAILKDLKLSKEMDGLIGASRHGNGNKQPFKPFRQQPGKGPGYNPRSWNTRHWGSTQNRFRGGFSQKRGKPSFFQNQEKQS